MMISAVNLKSTLHRNPNNFLYRVTPCISQECNSTGLGWGRRKADLFVAVVHVFQGVQSVNSSVAVGFELSSLCSSVPLSHVFLLEAYLVQIVISGLSQIGMQFYFKKFFL